MVFHASGFLRKNLSVDLCDCLYYFIDYLILILIAQRKKDYNLWIVIQIIRLFEYFSQYFLM